VNKEKKTPKKMPKAMHPFPKKLYATRGDHGFEVTVDAHDPVDEEGDLIAEYRLVTVREVRVRTTRAYKELK